MWVSIKGSTLEKGRTNGSDLVGKVLLAPGSSSYGPPPVDDELVTSGGGLALRNDLDGPDELDGSLEVEVKSVERLGL
jgi:hypothetical protein